jgi:hypothetical protein
VFSFRSIFVVFRTIILLLIAESASAQSDSLADVFPLAIGNRWVYKYVTDDIDLNYSSRSDSGTATYTVVSREVFPDSISWTIRQVRDLIRCDWFYFPGPDTCYPFRDTIQFQLTELTSGRHQIYRVGPWDQFYLSAFPFTLDYTDTVIVTRFAPVDSSGKTTYQSFPAVEGPFGGTGWFTFRKDVGLIQYYFNGTWWIPLITKVNHRLLSSITTGLPADGAATIGTGFALHQNYPNPFNPTTSIQYELPKSSMVNLSVYDLLGRQVSVLENERKEAGVHEVRFDGTGLSSGVYFYRLTASSYVQTRKLLLIR